MKMSDKSVNQVIGYKVRLLSRLTQMNEMFTHFEDVFNSLQSLEKTSNNVLNIFDNNCVKMCRISDEWKQTIETNHKLKANKQFNCFWPKCRFTWVVHPYRGPNTYSMHSYS